MNPLSSLILPPLSAIYSVVARARIRSYQRGWLSVSKLSAPVISVGNLTTGGTGKTPLVEWVCKAVESRKRVCVLTRGYGRANPQSQVVVSDGTKLLAAEREAGDEPYLLARNLLGIAAVVSNPDRVAAGEWAIKNLGSEVFVLDDGFQHLRLARDLDIVTIDATNPWGGGTLLPYGRLREPRAGLSRADCIVVTRTEQAEDTLSLTENVQRLAGAIPVFTSHMMTSGIHRLNGESVNNEGLPAQPVAAFCGVGNPESFFNQLRQEGCTPVFTRSFSDHHDYLQAELNQLTKEAKNHGATGLMTTAKDALKLASLELELPCYVLEIKISIDDETGLMKMIRAACL
ncbi:MAG TPA: tetraacyldisaccharide 4'-kinase [Pyrinomonadaceae bacterium]|nr:tetraacyldisaccharide 4'-kinase [Pyrinomonadaceae bacterium]